jgi:hypothetical protein
MQTFGLRPINEPNLARNKIDRQLKLAPKYPLQCPFLYPDLPGAVKSNRSNIPHPFKSAQATPLVDHAALDADPLME